MRKLALSNHALMQLRRFKPELRQEAMNGIRRLQSDDRIGVTRLATSKAPNAWAFSYGKVLITFRELHDELVVLGVFSRAGTHNRRNAGRALGNA